MKLTRAVDLAREFSVDGTSGETKHPALHPGSGLSFLLCCTTRFLMSETLYRRYTDLPALVNLLATRTLTLLDPGSWDDKNDSYFLSTYKEKKNLKSVLALCFTTAPETYHHWRVFSSGASGVCVHFDVTLLRNAMKQTKGVKFREMKYLKVNELRTKRPTVSQLPFIKRYPFNPEREVRALWESKDESRNFLDVPFDLAAIKRITVSPWLHPSLRKSLVSALKSIEGCEHIKIWRSTLTENAAWEQYGSSAT